MLFLSTLLPETNGEHLAKDRRNKAQNIMCRVSGIAELA
jgi:hypothetical protein